MSHRLFAACTYKRTVRLWVEVLTSSRVDAEELFSASLSPVSVAAMRLFRSNNNRAQRGISNEERRLVAEMRNAEE